MKKKLTIARDFDFEAAHHLPDYGGACKYVHGHSYKLRVYVTFKRNTGKLTNGMLMDYHTLDALVKQVFVSKFDHCDLNDHFDIPTAEVMVNWMFDELNTRIPKQYKVSKVILKETGKSYAIAEEVFDDEIL